MKTFSCDGCGALVLFENVQCLSCQRALGFLPDMLDLSALEPSADGTVEALSPSALGRRYRPCENGRQCQACNWLVPTEEAEPFCTACRLNELIPNLSDTVNRERWFKLEQAKRRLIYGLFHLELQLEGVPTEERPALGFQFLAATADEPVVTGHCKGLITLDIAEADDAERELRRVSLHEPYRTVLGHLRHEVGHY